MRIGADDPEEAGLHLAVDLIPHIKSEARIALEFRSRSDVRIPRSNIGPAPGPPGCHEFTEFHHFSLAVYLRASPTIFREGGMSVLWSDLRFAVRGLMKARGFSVAAIAALALGIGPNTAIFSVVYATLLAPLPFPEPDQLVMVWSKTPSGVRSARLARGLSRVEGIGDVVPVPGAVLAARLQPGDPRRAPARTGAPRHARRASHAWRGHRARTGFPARRRSAWAEPGRAAQQPALAPALRRRSRHHRPRYPHGRTALHRRRRAAAGAVRSPACGSLDAAHIRARRR